MKTIRAKHHRNRSLCFAGEYSRPFEQFLGRTLTQYERDFICALEKGRRTGQPVTAEIFNNPDFDHRPILAAYRKFLDHEYLETVIAHKVPQKADEEICEENAHESTTERARPTCCAQSCDHTDGHNSRRSHDYLSDSLQPIMSGAELSSSSPPDPPPEYHSYNTLFPAHTLARAPGFGAPP